MPRLMSVSLTEERLREVLEYDSDAGSFTWRHNGRRAGWTEPTGYVRIRIDQRNYLAHRLAWLYVYGVWPDRELDHINGVRHDFRIANLREIDHAGNTRNLHGAHADSRSGVAGVWKSAGRWAAQVFIDGKARWLGRFDTPEQAHEAYRIAKRELHPEWTESDA